MRKPKTKKERPPKPPKPLKVQKVFVEDTLLSVHKDEGKNYSEEMRVVVWVIDGKRTAAKLERRDKTFDEDTKRVKRSKCKGFLYSEAELIVKNWPAIRAAFEREANRVDEPVPVAATNGHIQDSPFV